MLLRKVTQWKLVIIMALFFFQDGKIQPSPEQLLVGDSGEMQHRGTQALNFQDLILGDVLVCLFWIHSQCSVPWFWRLWEVLGKTGREIEHLEQREREKPLVGKGPNREGRTQQHSKNWICLPSTLLSKILLFVQYLEYFVFGKHLSSVVDSHKCWRWYNFLLLMLWWIFNFFINAFIKFLTNVWVTSPNLVEEESGWAAWGVWRLQQLGGKHMWWLKSRCLGHPLQQVTLQQFHAPCLLLSQLYSLEFSCQESRWTCNGSSFLFPSGKGQWSWSIPLGIPSGHHTLWVSSPVLRAFLPLYLFIYFKYTIFKSFEEIRLNHSDFTLQEPHQSPDLLSFCVSSRLQLSCCHSRLGYGSIWKWFHSSRGLNKAHLHFNTISLTCTPRICLTGGNCFFISCSPLRSTLRNCHLTAEVSWEPGRAEIKFCSLLRTPSYDNFVIEPFCSALDQLPKEAQIAGVAV